MKLQTRSFVVRKPETIDITAFFKKFCIATRTKKKHLKTYVFRCFFLLYRSVYRTPVQVRAFRVQILN